ncbi:MAG: Fic family protein [Candidatus ainarchaeum sp.]|nr:Fic family protein [Candidatus ainarchaeum sp.]
MPLIKKKVKNKEYYYFSLSFRVLNKTKNFRKYIGANKPNPTELNTIEDNFCDEIIKKYLHDKFESKYLTKKQLIQIILFNETYFKKYNSLSPTKRSKYDVDKTVLFTLTTLTTEEVDVDIKDVLGAVNKKEKDLNLREQICKNMLSALEYIKNKENLNLNYIRQIHKITMADFETKKPGFFRDKQVYIYLKHTKDILNAEIKYRPPEYDLIVKKLKKIIDWYNNTEINPLEKAVIIHFEVYKIHPFLDGNKRVCRLLFNKALLDNGFPLINISDKKNQYFDALVNSVEKDDPTYLVKFTHEKYLKEILDFLKS